jgi:hypothetical protein
MKNIVQFREAASHSVLAWHGSNYGLYIFFLLNLSCRCVNISYSYMQSTLNEVLWIDPLQWSHSLNIPCSYMHSTLNESTMDWPPPVKPFTKHNMFLYAEHTERSTLDWPLQWSHSLNIPCSYMQSTLNEVLWIDPLQWSHSLTTWEALLVTLSAILGLSGQQMHCHVNSVPGFQEFNFASGEMPLWLVSGSCMLVAQYWQNKTRGSRGSEH